MAAPAPNSVDVTDLQFKLQCKSSLFSTAAPITDYCELISTASGNGLVFVGSSGPELKVFQTNALKDPIIDRAFPVRTVPLPSAPSQVSVNCDGSLVAVEVSIHGTTFLSIYSVPSFMSAQVHVVENIRVCPEANVKCRQLSWNPVIPASLAVCLTNGGLSMYTLKDKGFEFHSIDKAHAVQSICWSPKGKQIVAGHLGFKLVQYKPDLAVARVIQCPADPTWGQCSVITIQWLSTYQFAVAVLGQAPDAVPNLIVVNAPKSNQISMVNYDDICYGNSGPRPAQVFFMHLQSWNMLLVASANSVEVGVLATTETGDAPTWVQYCMLDEGRAEMPLTADKQESFPVGMTLDTATTHRLVIAEREMPVMPMVHLLSNHGQLISFNLINTFPNFVELCSPPRPLHDQSGSSQFVVSASSPPAAAVPAAPVAAAPQPVEPPNSAASINNQEITFNFAAASTPIAPQKSTSLFGGTTGLFGANTAGATAGASLFGGGSSTATAGGGGLFGNVAAPPAPVPQATAPSINPPKPAEVPASVAPPQPVKPLISVPPKFTSPAVGGPGQSAGGSIGAKDLEKEHELFRIMAKEDIQVLEKDIKELLNCCRGIDVRVGDQDEMRRIMKDLSGLTDFSQQAVETSEQLWTEIRTLNLSLNESFATTAVAKDLMGKYQNPEFTRLRDYTAQNQANRRQLMHLQNALTNNELQLTFIQNQLRSQWAEHEQVKKQYSKDRMHIPCLEGVYETLTRQKEILFREREKINYIKAKLGVRLTFKGHEEHDATVESIADSVLSLTLYDRLQEEARKVDGNKLSKLAAYLDTRPVTVISPKRSTREGWNSDVILERKERLSRTITPKDSMQAAKPAGELVRTKVVASIQKAPSQLAQPKATLAPVADPKPVIPKPTAPPSTKPLAFGGFGDGGPKAGGLFGNQTEPVSLAPAASKADVKPATKPPPPALVPLKENITPNVAPSKAPESVFAGFGALSTGGKVEENKPAPTGSGSTFSFNIPKPQSAVAVESTKKDFGNLFPSTLPAPASSASNSVSRPATSVSAAVTSAFGGSPAAPKPLFGGISSGPISFGGAGGTDDKQVFKLPDSTTITPTVAPPKEENILDTLKICSPNTVGSSIPAAAEAPKSIFSMAAFGTVMASNSSTSTANTPAVITSSLTAAAPAVVSSPSAPLALTVDKPAAPPATTVASSASSVFSGFGLPATASAAPPVTSTIASPASAGGSLFGSAFGSSPSATTSVFGSAAPAAAANPPAEGATTSFFGAKSTVSVSPNISATITPSVITSTSSSTLPKPDQSVFGQVPVTTPTTAASAAASTFSFGDLQLGGGAPAAAAASPFGGITASPGAQSPFGSMATAPPASTTPQSTGFGGTGGSLFGGTGSAFGGMGGGGSSVFGGGGAVAGNAASPGSIFGGGASTGFGSQPAAATTSIFGGGQQTKSSPFGAPAAAGGNIFGGGATTNSAPFGGGSGGAFGSPAAQSGGSMFGGASAFGSAASAAPAFGSPQAAGSPFGAQQSPASGGFGQPAGFGAAANAGGFGKPAAFGAAPTAFGQPATFGGPPVFGGGATFGSPTSSFGGFGGQPAASPPVAQNNLFATLGASESSLSFGNLAQTNSMQQQKPQFGGSAFSSWR